MGLSTLETEAARRLRRRLEERLGEQLLEMRVYGSRARGDAHEDSDLDVLVVVPAHDQRLLRPVVEEAYEVMTELGWPFYIAPLVMNADHLEMLRERELRLALEIDGLPPPEMSEANRQLAAADALARAGRELECATLLLGAESWSSCVLHADFAAVRAASALLYTRGEQPRPKEVSARFQHHFAEEPSLPSRALRYEEGPCYVSSDEPAAHEALTSAQEFVDAARAWLTALGYPL